jgi:HSP20 family protein
MQNFYPEGLESWNAKTNSMNGQPLKMVAYQIPWLSLRKEDGYGDPYIHSPLPHGPRAKRLTAGGVVMLMADPFDTLFAFQRALENRLSSDWLGGATASTGPYPPVNVFQRGDDLVAIVELPGVNREELNIQAKENTLRIAGRKTIEYPEDVSLHRRERLVGAFDRTLVVPMQIDPDGIKAEYNDGLLALFIPRAERDKPRNIQIR